MFKWLRYILTDEQNQWDMGILLWLLGATIFFYRSWTMPTFDPQSYGIGLTGVLGGGAALSWIRQLNKGPEQHENP